jgi:ABC-type uncharacterized transport system YnjBCD substrate-binding protein
MATAARRLGVRLRRVPVADTADAVQRVVAQRRAGRTSGGAVDLIWINGENFAAGKRAGLWLEDWLGRLPNARHLDMEDPTIARDFRVPVEGQEAPWTRAVFVVQAKGEDAGFAYLRRLKPLMYRGGETLPKSEAELNEWFADGEVDFAMSYDASFVQAGVRRGQFPDSARPLVLEDGSLANVSIVTIPADAAHRAGAQVVANLLLSPRLQATKADPQVLGHPTVLDLDRLPRADRARFEGAVASPYLLEDFGRVRGELPADEVPRLEARWEREVLRG